jgi:hypothetical protein
MQKIQSILQLSTYSVKPRMALYECLAINCEQALQKKSNREDAIRFVAALLNHSVNSRPMPVTVLHSDGLWLTNSTNLSVKEVVTHLTAEEDIPLIKSQPFAEGVKTVVDLIKSKCSEALPEIVLAIGEQSDRPLQDSINVVKSLEQAGVISRHEAEQLIKLVSDQCAKSTDKTSNYNEPVMQKTTTSVASSKLSEQLKLKDVLPKGVESINQQLDKLDLEIKKIEESINTINRSIQSFVVEQQEVVKQPEPLEYQKNTFVKMRANNFVGKDSTLDVSAFMVSFVKEMATRIEYLKQVQNNIDKVSKEFNTLIQENLKLRRLAHKQSVKEGGSN